MNELLPFLFLFLLIQQGEVKSQTNYHGLVDDHFYVLSEPFPSDPFYIQVDGVLHSGMSISQYRVPTAELNYGGFLTGI